MCNNNEFYSCEHCGNLIEMIHDARVSVMCCGQKMKRKCLEIGKAPIITFALSEEKPVAVYAYCNLHGLWKVNI